MSHDAQRGPDRVLLGLCALALAWAAVVFQAGGFTTSIGAGMAFLDWPLSNGSVNPPGWLTDLDMFAEHSHRLAAAKLGLIAIGLAVVHALREPRRQVRLLAFALVGLILVQGGLGGLRVMLDQLNTGADHNRGGVGFGIAHALMAQLTVATLAALTLSHTPAWRREDASLPARARAWAPLAPIALLLVMVAAAVMRQNRVTLWTPDGAGLFLPAVGDGWVWWVNALHRAGALVASAAVAGLVVACWRAGLARRLAAAAAAALVLQVTLGILAVTLPENPHPRTVHVIVGAVLFSSTCCLALLCRRARTADAR